MPETTITLPSADDERVTVVNVFTVDPARQEELFAALDRVTREVFTTLPGFVSANFHTSLDGTRVVNYAQWASMSAFQEAMARPEIRAGLDEVAPIFSSADPTLVRVRSVHHPS